VKKVGASLVAVAVALCSCSADPGYEPRYEPQQSLPHIIPEAAQLQTTKSPEAPRKTVVALQVCADRYALRLSGKSDSYAVLYNLEVTGSGNTVNVHDSMIPSSELEACMTNVLERMVVPDSVSSTPQASPKSRSMVGIVQVAAAPIALLPIVLVAAGVTILVGVTIYVATESLKEKERCKTVKADCIQSCTDGFMPSGQPDGMPFHECLRKCLEAENCWKIFGSLSPGY
jgi:hypothetical protein